jgi:ComEC/Rec2-related protein
MNQQRLLNFLFKVTFGFVSGIVVGSFVPVQPEYLSYLIGGTVFWLVVGYLLVDMFDDFPTTQAVISFFLIVSVSFMVGWGRYSYSLGRFYEDHISEYTTTQWSQASIVEGTVVAQPEVERFSSTLRISPTKVWPTKKSDKPITPSGGDIYVRISKDNYRDLAISYGMAASNEIYGDKLRVVGSMMKPFAQSNPGGFSYKTFLRSKGIYGAIWSPESAQILQRRRGNPIVAWALELQTEMLKTIKMTMPYPHSAFLGGATLGLREGLAYAQIPFGEGEQLISRVFQASGTSHVLAVSGLHVGVIAGAFLALFSGFRIPPKYYAPLILFALLIFTIITGARPATIRAAIMAGLVVVGMAYLEQGLKNSVLFGLCLAALFILLYNPKLIYEAAFTLSFSAVLCLALLTGPVERILDQIRDLTFVVFWVCLVITVGFWFRAWNLFFNWEIYLPYALIWSGIFYLTYQYDQNHKLLWGFGFEKIPTAISGFIAAQFAIQLGMMWPLSAYYFQAFPIAGAFANLIAIPLVGVVVPLGLLVGLIGLIPQIGPWLALVLNAGNYLAVTAFLWVTYFFSTYFPYPLVRKMPLFQVAVLYALLILLAFWEPIFSRFKRSIYWFTDNVFHRLVVKPATLFIGIIAVSTVALFGASFQYVPSMDSLQVTVLNMGYGNAIAIRTPDEKRILLNGGTRLWDWHNQNNLPERRDKGRRIVASYFLNERVKTLDLVAVQAPEPQYVGGVPVILNHFTVNEVIATLPEKKLTPFNKKSYVRAINHRYESYGDPSYYEEQADADWFHNDYYRNWRRLWRAIKADNIPYATPTRGEIVFEGRFPSQPDRTITMEVLHPAKDSTYSYSTSSNRSLVLSLRVENGPSFLFPGDIRSDAQRDLVEQLPPGKLKHDVMIVPSSGMQESSISDTFVQGLGPNNPGVRPDHLIFSTGPPEIKPYSLSKEMEKALKENYKQAKSLVGADNIYRTDRDKAITLSTKGEELRIRTIVGNADG